ncbi:MAG: hypothetical protein GF399_02865 [Candidatus Coatesbacteria bacterium]|nr:hypothetical protein [Candidatus Coatesbacteria bacterium]
MSARRVIPVSLLVILLAGCGGENGGREDQAGPTVRTTEEEDTADAAVAGPGKTWRIGPYTLTTPNALWRNLSYGGRVFFARVTGAGRADEIAYLEIYELPQAPPATARALALGRDPGPTLLEDLRDLIAERVEEPTFVRQQLGFQGLYHAATLIYRDHKETFGGGTAQAHNEVCLVLVEGTCHLFSAYCYAGEAAALEGEFADLCHSVSIEPPPPPVVVSDEDEQTDGADEATTEDGTGDGAGDMETTPPETAEESATEG